MSLSDTACRNAKPADKPRKLSDEKGLFLLVTPNGGKWWRLKYRFGGKEKLLSLGTYPEVGLALARERRDEFRRMLARGIDPSDARKAEKAEALEDSTTFELVAREWFEKFRPSWSASHADRIIRRLEVDVFPWIGRKPIKNITARELLDVIRRIEKRGALETAHRALQNCSQVFRFAISAGCAEHDPTSGLRGALPPSKEKHHASITDPKGVAELLRAIDTYSGSFLVRCALRLTPLVFVRPGELRHAEWQEIDMDSAEWRIPAAKMKMREQHIVPLSTQATEILRELHPLTGDGKYVFPSARTSARPMSENTVTAALRRLGFTKDEMTAHGFRSMASTILNEQGWDRDAIERQLAHAERDNVRAAYNFAEHLPLRRKMMQSWSDYLDGLKAGGKVLPIFQGKTA